MPLDAAQPSLAKRNSDTRTGTTAHGRKWAQSVPNPDGVQGILPRSPLAADFQEGICGGRARNQVRSSKARGRLSRRPYAKGTFPRTRPKLKQEGSTGGRGLATWNENPQSGQGPSPLSYLRRAAKAAGTFLS